MSLKKSLGSSKSSQRGVGFLCSWCGDSIGPVAHLAEQPENFGICPSCLESELARLGPSKRGKRARNEAELPVAAAPGRDRVHLSAAS